MPPLLLAEFSLQDTPRGPRGHNRAVDTTFKLNSIHRAENLTKETRLTAQLTKNSDKTRLLAASAETFLVLESPFVPLKYYAVSNAQSIKSVEILTCGC